jgi:hypothetical protein
VTISRNLSLIADNIDSSGLLSLTTGVTGTLPVANGTGTGATSATAYAVQCGGTTSTGAYQSVASVGTAGQVLTSNGAAALPTFQAASGFASGTKMLFAQTSAPTGWTKDTTNYNNYALRVVTGAAASGGTVDFTTAFASQAVAGSNANTTATNNSYTPAGSTSISGTTGSTTLSTSEIPSHTHTFPSVAFSGGTSAAWAKSDGTFYTNYTTNSTGGGGSHNHSFSGSGSLSGTAATITQAAHTHTFTGTAINLAVKYLDVILATKD